MPDNIQEDFDDYHFKIFDQSEKNMEALSKRTIIANQKGATHGDVRRLADALSLLQVAYSLLSPESQ